MKKNIRLSVCVILILLLISSEGCLKRYDKINDGYSFDDVYNIAVVIDLISEEVDKINFTELGNTMENLSYDVHVLYNENDYILCRKNATDSKYGGDYWVRIEKYENFRIYSVYDSMGAWDTDDNSRYSEEKKYLTEKINDFAQIANLTIDWDNAEWEKRIIGS